MLFASTRRLFARVTRERKERRDRPRGDPRRYRSRRERDFWADAEGLPTRGPEPTEPPG